MNHYIFEAMAASYDTPERVSLAQVITKELKTNLRDAKTKALMDYGSGTGLVSLPLADSVKSMLLVDSSQSMIEIAEGKILRNGIRNARTLTADFTTYKAPLLKTDLLLMSLVLLHIPDTKKILTAVYELLNENGQLLIVDFDKNEKVSHPLIHSGFTHEELKNLVSEAGFSDFEMETFHHGKNIFMKEDASLFLATCLKK